MSLSYATRRALLLRIDWPAIYARFNASGKSVRRYHREDLNSDLVSLGLPAEYTPSYDTVLTHFAKLRSASETCGVSDEKEEVFSPCEPTDGETVGAAAAEQEFTSSNQSVLAASPQDSMSANLQSSSVNPTAGEELPAETDVASLTGNNLAQDSAQESSSIDACSELAGSNFPSSPQAHIGVAVFNDDSELMSYVAATERSNEAPQQPQEALPSDHGALSEPVTNRPSSTNSNAREITIVGGGITAYASPDNPAAFLGQLFKTLLGGHNAP